MSDWRKGRGEGGRRASPEWVGWVRVLGGGWREVVRSRSEALCWRRVRAEGGGKLAVAVLPAGRQPSTPGGMGCVGRAGR